MAPAPRTPEHPPHHIEALERAATAIDSTLKVLDSCYTLLTKELQAIDNIIEDPMCFFAVMSAKQHVQHKG
jgi:hypothetical protein